MGTVVGFDGERPRRRETQQTIDQRERPQRAHFASSDLIPMLLGRSASIAASPGQIGPEDIIRITPLAVTSEADVLLDAVEEVFARGVPHERILIDLLAPIARRLGELWEDDRLDFIDVTMALWRLQEVMRELSTRAGRQRAPDSARRSLFTAMPGDNHGFGPAIVQECFMLAGWEADLLIGASRNEVISEVADQSLDLFGLTLTCDAHIEPAVSLIRAIRSVSLNQHLCVMVGGRTIVRQPHLVALLGADGTAETAVDAVTVAERLVDAARLAATA